MIVDTQLCTDHIELIKIFIEANELVEMQVIEREVNIRGKNHRMITLFTLNEDTSTKLTFMGLRHAGVLNMLDDFLIKCNVSPHALQPQSLRLKEHDEKQKEKEAELQKHLSKIKEQNEHINE